jgi:hypothetical protein
MMIIVDAGTSYKYGAYLSDKSDATTLACKGTTLRSNPRYA